MKPPGMATGLERLIAALIAAARWLVLPVSLLLFLQWPLRELLHRWSVQANDLAQWLFALYVAVALTHATRSRVHLAIDGFARRLSPASRDSISRAGTLLCLLPWAVFVLLSGAPSVWRSVRQLESFAETSDPGYFLVKLSALLLALLLAAQGLLDLLRPRDR